MRLLNTKTYLLHENDELPRKVKRLPPYAVLSHTWIPSIDGAVQEVTYQDMVADSRRLHLGKLKKKGWEKLSQYCDFAASQGFEWAWMDTCCIDKTSLGDTQEAINAMFRWYRDADLCYAYLADVDASAQNETASEILYSMRQSNWFRRGWTLQELLAPPCVVFLNSKWEVLGTREGLAEDISDITKINVKNLTAFIPQNLNRASIACRLSWASERETTVEEDETYSLLGLFDLSLPLIYGEGREQAFYRFQRELANRYDDDSLFAWHNIDAIVSFAAGQGHGNTLGSGLLAPSIRCFRQSTDIHFRRTPGPFSLTNQGITITRALHHIEGGPQLYVILEMNCYRQSSESSPEPIGIVVDKEAPLQRVEIFPMVVRSSSNGTRSATWKTIAIDGEKHSIGWSPRRSTVTTFPPKTSGERLLLSIERVVTVLRESSIGQLVLEGSLSALSSYRHVDLRYDDSSEMPLSELLNGSPMPTKDAFMLASRSW